MKTVALMQPYIFPYIGYFQLFHAADIFIYYDNVQFIKGGWINRNRILAGTEPLFFSIPLRKGTSTMCINERIISKNKAHAFKKILGTIRQYYVKAPYFQQVYRLIESSLETKEENIARFAACCNQHILDYLDLHPTIRFSSELAHDTTLTGQDRVIDLVKSVEGGQYINLLGGMDLYEPAAFTQHQIDLKFIQCLAEPYQQFAHTFVPYLSILDALMFNDKDAVRRRLTQYALVDKTQ